MWVHVALIHYPVYNQKREVIVSAVTNLDIHDIARTACTYGVRGYHLVTPLEEQQRLVRRLLDHWLQGHGGRTHPERRQALSLVRLAGSLPEVLEAVTADCGQRPAVIATGAAPPGVNLSYGAARTLVQQRPVLLLFGTAWGLSREVMAAADFQLEPVQGATGYNHLPVRSAAAIILDRILGPPRGGNKCRCLAD